MIISKTKNLMQRDIELFEEFDLSQKKQPIFFFYTWKEPAITIGKIQRNRNELIKEAESLGIPCYLRPTGGRAVLHGGDICYTFIGVQSDPIYGGKLKDSFRAVNNLVTKMLNEVLNLEGSKIVMMNRSTEAQNLVPRAQSDMNCFSSAVCNEALIDGHKIIGAAQAMGKRAFIQQGSIQVNPCQSKLSYFRDSPNLATLINNGKDLDLVWLCDELNSLVKSQGDYFALLAMTA